MAAFGVHVNAIRPGVREMVLASPHLKILDTATDLDLLAEWRGRYPFGTLVYRKWFMESESRDVTYRCDKLLLAAETVQMFMPILEIPWNEERQSGDDLSRYDVDSCKATLILRAEGYLVVVGNFGVTWPIVSDVLRYLAAFALGDFHGFHEYSWPSMAGGWGRIGHYKAVEAVLPVAARKPVLLTEFGLDKLLTGVKGGWRDAGLTGLEYADQLRVARKQVDTAKVAYIFCNGQFGDWAGYDVAGEPAIEALLREQYEEVPVSPEEFDRWAADVWHRAGVPLPDTGIAKYWKTSARAGHYLGRPEGPEHRTENGLYAYQEFSGAILHCKVGEWIVSKGLPPFA